MKSKEQLRDEAAEEFDKASWYGRSRIDYFKAGFDYRDQLDNKALEIAVEALKFYADGEGDVLDWNGVNNPAYLQAKGRIAKEALEKIEGFKDFKAALDARDKDLCEQLVDVLSQACGTYNRDKNIVEYDHLCISTYQDALRYSIEIGLIKEEQLLRKL